MTRRNFLFVLMIVLGLFAFYPGEMNSSRRKSKRASKQPPKQPLDVNKASVEELERVPGIGPLTAQAIVSYREKNGPFRRLEELMIIRGIGEERFEKLRGWLTVGK